MTNKKLGLLLCPLLPLAAIGIVEVAGALASMNTPEVVVVRETHTAPAPVVRFAEPPAPAPTPAPAPVPEPTAPRSVTSD